MTTCQEYLDSFFLDQILHFDYDRAIGELGEEIARDVAASYDFRDEGFVPAKHGFDAVYRDQQGNIVIVEAKATEVPGPQALNKDTVQMSPQWAKARAEKMTDSHSALNGHSAANTKLGQEILHKLEAHPDQIRYVLIHTHPDGKTVDTYEKLGGEWKLVSRKE